MPASHVFLKSMVAEGKNCENRICAGWNDSTHDNDTARDYRSCRLAVIDSELFQFAGKVVDEGGTHAQEVLQPDEMYVSGVQISERLHVPPERLLRAGADTPTAVSPPPGCSRKYRGIVSQPDDSDTIRCLPLQATIPPSGSLSLL